MHSIRRANVWDAPKITFLWQKMIGEISVHPSIQEDCSDLEMFYLSLLVKIKSPNWRIFVALDDEAGCIGFIMGEIRRAQYNSEKLIGFCEATYVEKKYRNTGLGRKLTDTIIEEAKVMGAQEAEFIVPFNKAIIKRGESPVYMYYKKDLRR